MGVVAAETEHPDSGVVLENDEDDKPGDEEHNEVCRIDVILNMKTTQLTTAMSTRNLVGIF